MGNIDLDKSRAERAAEREGKGEGPTFTLGGETFALPVEMPYNVVPHLASAMSGVVSAVPRVFETLLGDEEYKRFTEQAPTMDDLFVLIEGVMVEYGFNDAGES